MVNFFQMDWPAIFNFTGFIGDIFTVVASGIAVYLFVTKREVISSAFQILLNYSAQLTFTELRGKLDRLNDFNANDSTHREEIINILSDILGQLRGNQFLATEMKDLISKISKFSENREQISEPKKRVLTAELRERLKHISCVKFGEMTGD